MIDYFALLGFVRTPWLEAAEVQKRFLEISAAAHPDRVHNLGLDETAAANARFAELNKAAVILKDTKERLHHLLALETGAAPATAQNIPNELIELFGMIGQTCRSVDQFMAEKNRATSPMLQAQMFGKGLEWNDVIAELQGRVGEVKARAEAELQQIGKNWPREKPLARIAGLAHVFAMTGRWEAQLQERFAALASN
jgi:DnaJ-domain-containing protein 1